MVNSLAKIKTYFFAERERWFLWLPFLLACGVIIYFSLYTEPSPYIGAMLSVIILLLVVKNGYASKYSLIYIMLFLVSLGFSFAQIRANSLYQQSFIKRNTYASFSGKIIKLDNYRGRCKAVINDLHFYPDIQENIPEQIKITFSAKQKFEVGDYIKGKAKLLPPSLPIYPGAFDIGKDMYFSKISASGYAFYISKDKNRVNQDVWWSDALLAIERIRLKMSSRIISILGKETGSIVATIIAGDRSAISYDRVKAYRNSGLAHFLSISGLHMSMVSGLFFFGVRYVLALFPWMALNFNIKKISAFISIIASFAYLLISGAAVPTQRAFIMVAIVLLGVLMDRKALSLRTISFAAIVVMFISPEAVLGPSFQMSFFAVIALISAYETNFSKKYIVKNIRENSPKYKVVYAYFIGVVFSDLIASLATTPFALYHFNQMAPYTLLANFCAAPFIGFVIMPFAVISALLMPIGLDKTPLLITGLGVEKLNQITDFVSSIKGSELITPHMPDWGIALIAFSMLWLCLWQLNWRYIGIVGIIIGLLSPWLEQKPDFYISADSSTIAYKINGEFNVVKLKQNSFVQRHLFEYLGQKYNKNQLLDVDKLRFQSEIMMCDNSSCIYKNNSKILALSLSPLSLHEDCVRADVIIALYPINQSNCSGKKTIDIYDLHKNGGYFIYLDNPTKIVNSKDVANDRLWNR